MARPLRLDYCGAVWHLTVRGNECREIVRDDHHRQAFVELLGRCVQKYAWVLHTWTLMDNHYYLVVEVPEANISRGMQWLNGCYAQRFNRRHGRVGHLFQCRFKGILPDSDEYLLRLCRYVVLNPVRAGMVSRPEEWCWSSYRATAGLEPTPNWLTTSTLLSRIAPDPEEARLFKLAALQVASRCEEWTNIQRHGEADRTRSLCRTACLLLAGEACGAARHSDERRSNSDCTAAATGDTTTGMVCSTLHPWGIYQQRQGHDLHPL